MPTGTLLNQSVGAYRIVGFLGAGGMGEVYRAVHVALGRTVAMKVLTSPGLEPTSLERFRNEARIHAALHHPHIATLYDFLEVDGRPCIVMELVSGSTLDERLRRQGPLATADALPIVERVVDAVGYLHARGIVHRDLKSNNVKVSSAGAVKLLDFGIAKGQSSPKLTVVGGVVGTVQYLSPEQLDGLDADHRSDIWALGVLFYEMLTARMPFEGASMTGVVEAILRGSYRPASSLVTGVSRTADLIIARCLAKRPKDRYQSAEALLTDLRGLAVPAPETRLRTLHTMAGTPAPPERPAAAAISGEARALVGRVRRQWQLVVAGGAVAASLVFLAASLRPSPNGDDGRRRDTAATGDTTARGVAPPADTTTAPPRVPATPSSAETVTIDVFGAPADVVREGKTLGRTPLVLPARPGDRVDLVLRRDGSEDIRVGFIVSVNTREYTYTMLPASHASPQSDRRVPPAPEPIEQAAIAPWLAAGLRRLFGRRRKTPARPAIATPLRATGERAALAGAANPLRLADARVGIATDVGCVRETNEDSISVVRAEGALLAVVADGMGGHASGEVASRIAVDAIARGFASDATDPRQSLVRAVQDANRAIYDAAASDAALDGMGTTCTAVLVRDGLAYCAHVGDSRLYLVRDGELFLMTEDHSAVNELVRRREISREDARGHPDRNVIIRALGSRREIDVAAWPQAFSVRDGDRFLLCSDGLYDLVSEAQLLESAATAAPQDGCERLVAAARARGGHDNISVAIVALESAPAAEPRTTRVMRVSETAS
jgi:serine/threonine protein phosphatase PrpC